MKNDKIKYSLFNIIYAFLLLLLPIIYSSDILDSVLIPRQLFLSFFVLITAVLVWFGVSKQKISIDFGFVKLRIITLALLFVFVVIISFTSSIVLSESIYFLSKILLLFAFFGITTLLFINKKISISFISKLISVFSGIVILIAIFQAFRFNADIMQIKSTMANKNLMSSLLFLCFPFVLFNLFGNSRWQYFSLFIIFSSIMLFWFVQTKTVLIATLLYSIVSIIFVIRYIKSTNKINGYLNLLCFLP